MAIHLEGRTPCQSYAHITSVYGIITPWTGAVHSMVYLHGRFPLLVCLMLSLCKIKPVRFHMAGAA